MGLCIFTTFNVLQDAYHDLDNSTFANGTQKDPDSHKEGFVSILGIGSAFAFALLLYSLRSAYRWKNGIVPGLAGHGEDTLRRPLLSSSTLVNGINNAN